MTKISSLTSLTASDKSLVINTDYLRGNWVVDIARQWALLIGLSHEYAADNPNMLMALSLSLFLCLSPFLPVKPCICRFMAVLKWLERLNQRYRRQMVPGSQYSLPLPQQPLCSFTTFTTVTMPPEDTMRTNGNSISFNTHSTQHVTECFGYPEKLIKVITIIMGYSMCFPFLYLFMGTWRSLGT